MKKDRKPAPQMSTPACLEGPRETEDYSESGRLELAKDSHGGRDNRLNDRDRNQT